MQVRISREALSRMRAHAVRSAPEECCGLLLGSGRFIAETRPAANVADDRLRHFEIDPQALIDAHRQQRAGGPELIGYYHSHPEGPAKPSATDRAEAAGDSRVWGIIGKTDVAFWCDGEEDFVPLSYAVEDR